MRPNIFETAAMALYRCGYSVLPIMQGAKRPGTYRGFITEDGDGPWFGLKDWHLLCSTPETEAQVGAWGRMADAMGGGLGVACGYGGLIAIDIDDDELVAPILDVLPQGFIGKVGRKGLTALVRAAEPMPSTPYDDANGHRLLDFLSTGRQTVLPPTRHADTNEPYRWTTEQTLLNTAITDLPLFTSAHREAMKDVLRRYGWDAPEPRVARSKAVVERPVRTASEPRRDDDVNDAALMKLSAWVPALGLPKTRPYGVGYRAVAPWRGSSSGRPMVQRGAHLSFHPDGIKDFGTDDKFTPVGVVAKAHGGSHLEAAAWLRAQLALPDVPAIISPSKKPEPLVSSQDDRLPLAEAEEKVANIIASFFDEAVPAYVAWSNAWKLDANAPRRTKLPPLAQGWSVRVEMGIGKTHTATVTIADQVRRHRQIVYVVPNHTLAEEVALKFKAQKIDAAIYRGAERKDPRNPTKDMCLNPKARKAAEALGISVRKAVCVDSAVDIVPVRCPFAGQCGVEWQRTLQPQLWIVPSSLLMMHRPDFIPEPDAVVIDERFHEASIDKPKVIDLDTLLTAPISDTCRHDERTALTEGRESLRAAILANGPGPLSRAALLEHGISSERADWLSSLERRMLDPTVLNPNMPVADLVKFARKHEGAYNVARALSALWDEIAEFLYGKTPEWARLTVTKKGGVEAIKVRPLRTLHESWRAPTLILDATAPPVDVLERSLGDALSNVVEKADITAQWSEHVHVRQVFGAPVAMGKVGLYGEDNTENVRDILRFVRWRAALSYPADIGLITYKGLLEELQDKLPKNVTVTAHFGALAGLNSMERVAGLIVLGRPYIKPVAAEANAEVFGGQPVPPVGVFYPAQAVTVRLANGTDYDVNVDSHQDHLAEAFRWQATERGLLQAVGRLRPHRRTAHCWLDLVADVELPIPVHEKVGWDAAMPGAVGDMANAGVILLNRRDVAVAFDDLSERQGRSNGRAEVGYDSLYYNIKGIVPNLPCHRITYQKAGPGQKRNTGYYLPAVIGQPAALRTWLETKLGPLVALEIEHPTQLAEWQPETMPLGELVRAFGGWLGELTEASEG